MKKTELSLTGYEPYRIELQKLNALKNLCDELSQEIRDSLNRLDDWEKEKEVERPEPPCVDDVLADRVNLEQFNRSAEEEKIARLRRRRRVTEDAIERQKRTVDELTGDASEYLFEQVRPELERLADEIRKHAKPMLRAMLRQKEIFDLYEMAGGYIHIIDEKLSPSHLALSLGNPKTPNSKIDRLCREIGISI